MQNVARSRISCGWMHLGGKVVVAQACFAGSVEKVKRKRGWNLPIGDPEIAAASASASSLSIASTSSTPSRWRLSGYNVSWTWTSKIARALQLFWLEISNQRGLKFVCSLGGIVCCLGPDIEPWEGCSACTVCLRSLSCLEVVESRMLSCCRHTEYRYC